MSAAAHVPPSRSAEDFRSALSETSEPDWSASLARAQSTTRTNGTAAARLSRARPRRSVWSDETVWGWLTWSPTDTDGPGYELAAIGVVDRQWARNKRRRRAAFANAEQGVRRIYKRRLPTLSRAGIIRGGIAGLIVLIIFAGIIQTKGGWPIPVTILVGIAGYYWPSITALGSARHVRVFTGPALSSTGDALYELLKPVTAIAKAIRGSAVSDNDRAVVAPALSNALTAAWQATDPDSTRPELAAIIQRLDSMAVAVTDVTRSTIAVSSASQVQGASADGRNPFGAEGAGRTGALLTQLDEASQSLVDHAIAQQSAAEALRDINQPGRPADQQTSPHHSDTG